MDTFIKPLPNGANARLLSSTVVRLVVPFETNRSWEQHFLLASDRHLDSPYSNHKLQKEHLEEALDRKAIIMDFGDLFDAMQGKRDPRHSKTSLRKEFLEGTYWDTLVDYAAEFFEPYSDNIAMLASGNHETAVMRKSETNLTRRLAYRLKTFALPPRGFVEIAFNCGKKWHKRLIYFAHGGGSGGEVTRGTIKTNRRAVYIPQADVVVSGHIHESWYFEVPRIHVNGRGEIAVKPQYHVQLPTYKEETMKDVWWETNEYGPKSAGAWWMIAKYADKGIKLQFERAD